LSDAGSVSECWVEAVAGARSDVESLLVGWFEEPARILVTRALSGLAVGESPADRLKHRVSQWVPLAVFVFSAVFHASLWIGRRADMGLYRLLGLTGGGMAAMVAMDYVFAALAPFAIGLFGAEVLLAKGLRLLAATIAAWDALRAVALLTSVPLLILGLLLTVKPFEAIRGR
jgi:hypothetical protein